VRRAKTRNGGESNPATVYALPASGNVRILKKRLSLIVMLPHQNDREIRFRLHRISVPDPPLPLIP